MGKHWRKGAICRESLPENQLQSIHKFSFEGNPVNATLGLGRRFNAVTYITCGFFATSVLLIVFLGSLLKTIDTMDGSLATQTVHFPLQTEYGQAGRVGARISKDSFSADEMDLPANLERSGVRNPTLESGTWQQPYFRPQTTEVDGRALGDAEDSSEQPENDHSDKIVLGSDGIVASPFVQESDQLTNFVDPDTQPLITKTKEPTGESEPGNLANTVPSIERSPVAGPQKIQKPDVFPEVLRRLPPLYEQVTTASASRLRPGNSSESKAWPAPEFPPDVGDLTEGKKFTEFVEGSDSKAPVILKSDLPALPVANQVRPQRIAQNQPSTPSLPIPEPDSGTGTRQTNPQEDSGTDRDEETLGEEPESPDPQFLRDQTILLDPGEYQIEWGIQYLQDSSDFTLAQLVDSALVIAEARRRARVLLTPLEFRYGLSPVWQANVNIPWGFSSNEFAFFSTDEFGNAGGLGDVSVGLTGLLVEGKNQRADVLMIAAVTAPTGESSFGSTLAVPGSSLGEGFWAFTAGINFIRTYDPVVIFWGAGYRHRLQADFEDELGGILEVDPGAHAFYRLGVGFAINPQVTVGASFVGSYIAENSINGLRTAGGIREPIMLRLNVTIADQDQKKNKQQNRPKGKRKAKTTEPFVNIGLTETAADVMFGISWTK